MTEILGMVKQEMTLVNDIGRYTGYRGYEVQMRLATRKFLSTTASVL